MSDDDIKEYRINIQGETVLDFMSGTVYAKTPEEAITEFCEINKVSNEDKFNSKIYIKLIDEF